MKKNSILRENAKGIVCSERSKVLQECNYKIVWKMEWNQKYVVW